MKKISLVVFPALTIVLEALPLGAVCTFAPSPTERVRETFSYFSLIPFGYIISLMPLMYGLNNYSLVGALITIALVTESIFVKTQQK